MNKLVKLINAIDAVNRSIGHAVAWLVLALIIVQFTVVILRYVFAIGFIPVQESIWYMHGIIFMLGAGYTLWRDGHVRVDVFYRDASPRKQAWVDLIGACFLLLPLCVVTWWLSWSYVGNAWRIREASTEVSGLPFIYLLKSVILIFVALLFIQAISLLLKAVLVLRGAQLEKS